MCSIEPRVCPTWMHGATHGKQSSSIKFHDTDDSIVTSNLLVSITTAIAALLRLYQLQHCLWN